jgi:dethiobiotin synthetase/malonyl-CoA O-methyltransferase
MTGLFVTGTDTGVGKTMVAAWLVRSWQADYWKPVQSGTLDGRDADVIRQVAPEAAVHASAYELSAALSPHEAARLEGVTIGLDALHLPPSRRPLVVEGAGGALVPLNERDLMVDLMARLGLPVLVVARSGLGTINHTLLTIEAIRRRGLTIAGVVMNGPPNPANRRAIELFGDVLVVGVLPTLAGPLALIDHPPIPWRLSEFPP